MKLQLAALPENRCNAVFTLLETNEPATGSQKLMPHVCYCVMDVTTSNPHFNVFVYYMLRKKTL